MTIALASETEFNYVFVLQSVTPVEPQTGANLYRGTIKPICDRDGQGCDFREPASPAELVAILKEIEVGCRTRGWLPLLHLDTHGDDIRGLRIEPSGRYLSWDDLGAHLRMINRACANRLVVVVAACDGIAALSCMADVDVFQRAAPFYHVVGPDDLVTAPALERAMHSFYRGILSSTSIHDAVAAHRPPFQEVLVEGIFFKSMLTYLHDQCMGSGLERRIQRLLPAKIAYERRAGRVPNPQQILQSARRTLRAEAFDLEKYKRQFLMADDPRNVDRFKVTLDELLAELRNDWA